MSRRNLQMVVIISTWRMHNPPPFFYGDDIMSYSELKKEYQIIKNENKSHDERVNAMKRAETIAQTLIAAGDRTLVPPSKGQYAGLIGNTPTPDIVWTTGKDLSSFMTYEQDLLEKVTEVAYNMTRKQHPKMSDTSSTFGQIVNAKITHLLTIRNRLK